MEDYGQGNFWSAASEKWFLSTFLRQWLRKGIISHVWQGLLMRNYWPYEYTLRQEQLAFMPTPKLFERPGPPVQNEVENLYPMGCAYEKVRIFNTEHVPFLYNQEGGTPWNKAPENCIPRQFVQQCPQQSLFPVEVVEVILSYLPRLVLIGQFATNLVVEGDKFYRMLGIPHPYGVKWPVQCQFEVHPLLQFHATSHLMVTNYLLVEWFENVEAQLGHVLEKVYPPRKVNPQGNSLMVDFLVQQNNQGWMLRTPATEEYQMILCDGSHHLDFVRFVLNCVANPKPTWLWDLKFLWTPGGYRCVSGPETTIQDKRPRLTKGEVAARWFPFGELLHTTQGAVYVALGGRSEAQEIGRPVLASYL